VTTKIRSIYDIRYGDCEGAGARGINKVAIEADIVPRRRECVGFYLQNGHEFWRKLS
jgi:hypothetical protein